MLNVVCLVLLNRHVLHEGSHYFERLPPPALIFHSKNAQSHRLGIFFYFWCYNCLFDFLLKRQSKRWPFFFFVCFLLLFFSLWLLGWTQISCLRSICVNVNIHDLFTRTLLTQRKFISDASASLGYIVWMNVDLEWC